MDLNAKTPDEIDGDMNRFLADHLADIPVHNPDAPDAAQIAYRIAYRNALENAVKSGGYEADELDGAIIEAQEAGAMAHGQVMVVFRNAEKRTRDERRDELARLMVKISAGSSDE